MPAVFALHVDGNDGMDRRNEQKHVKDQPEDQTRHDKDKTEDGRERLAVQQKTDRRNQGGKDVDHRLILPIQTHPVCKLQLSRRNG